MSITNNILAIVSDSNLLNALVMYITVGVVSLIAAIDLSRYKCLFFTISKYIFALLSIGMLGSATVMLLELQIYAESTSLMGLTLISCALFTGGVILHETASLIHKWLNKIKGNTHDFTIHKIR